ncbi:hypothetical protein F9C11_29525 [Amycolatopsis sp. VS8301801F10]|uniref:hypothetical protein n=1 Tax=Amycolatopsis sp. VS8301801F10 TaxID=2652442 RepID=UPI0038FC728B
MRLVSEGVSRFGVIRWHFREEQADRQESRAKRPPRQVSGRPTSLNEVGAKSELFFLCLTYLRSGNQLDPKQLEDAINVTDRPDTFCSTAGQDPGIARR